VTNPRNSERSNSLESRSGQNRRKRWRFVVSLLIAVLVAFGVATARWFIWPRQGMPSRVDAIVMLNGRGDRLDTALDLAWAHRAPMIVISRGSKYWGHGSVCAPKISHVTVICFDPDPATTRGEAEFAGHLARQYHWHSVVLVTVAPQDTVARIRLERCFSGKIYVVNAPMTVREWLYLVPYEWGSTIKALSVQRSC
jgi:hypothetical protein